VQGHDHPLLLADRLTAVNASWISGTAPHTEWVYGAKTRYRQQDAACSLSSATADGCVVDFAENQWAVTPGQSVVLYESRVCIGGGIIESARQAQAAAPEDGCPPGAVADGG